MDKLKILMVDDDIEYLELLQSILEEMLESREVEFFAYSDASKAQKILEQEKFDLITFDLMMKELNGKYLIAQARKKGALNEHTHIIMISGYMDAINFHPSKVYFVEKPLKFEYLTKIISGILHLKS